MSLDSLYADRLDALYRDRVRNPAPPPEESFSLWSALGAGLKGPAGGVLQTSGSVSDLLSGFGTALASTGGSAQGMFSAGSDEERKQEDAARKRMLEGQAFDTSAGRVLRQTADRFAPPETAHIADRVLYDIFRVGSKAILDVSTMGVVPGALVFGLDEGNTTTQTLVEKHGIDPVTAAKVGIGTGVIAGLTAGIPAVGSTIPRTVGLALATGPAAYVAQEKMAKTILQNANYPETAAEHDLTALGFGLSMVPLAVGGVHIRNLRARTLQDAVKHIESGGRRFGPDGQLLTSPKGAQGEMQVMPGTAADPGFGITPARDNSPEEIARVGRDYLAAMQQRYGDQDKALAAYNAGPGAVDKAVAGHGADWLAHMPEETRAYVAKANKLLGEHAVETAAADPQTLDAARVRVLNDTLGGLPDHPQAYPELMRAADAIAEGPVQEVPAPARLRLETEWQALDDERARLQALPAAERPLERMAELDKRQAAIEQELRDMPLTVPRRIEESPPNDIPPDRPLAEAAQGERPHRVRTAEQPAAPERAAPRTRPPTAEESQRATIDLRKREAVLTKLLECLA